MVKVLDGDFADSQQSIESRAEGLLEIWKDSLKTVLVSVIEELNQDFARDDENSHIIFQLNINNYNSKMRIADIIALDKRGTNKKIITFKLSIPKIDKVLKGNSGIPIFIDNNMNEDIDDKLVYFETNLIGLRSWHWTKFTERNVQERLIKKISDFIGSETSMAIVVIEAAKH